MAENYKAAIQTVRGRIHPEQLGYCQCHEHLFIARGKSFAINPALLMDELDKSVYELERYKKLGGCSIVDAQPVGCGRMAPHLLEASLRTGVNIIASTGFHKAIFYPEKHWIFNKDVDYFTELYTNELREGMYIGGDNEAPDKTIPAKCGIIKTALDVCGITGNYEKLFAAAADASMITGIPIICHIEKGSNPFELIEYMIHRSIPMNKLILCHLDRTECNPEYHMEIAKAGVYLEYDTIGRFKYHSDDMELKLIYGMTEKGFAGQILMGLDTTRERLKSYGGAIGLDYLLTTFIPLMKSYGFDDETINRLAIDNPAQALECQII